MFICYCEIIKNDVIDFVGGVPGSVHRARRPPSIILGETLHTPRIDPKVFNNLK